MAEAGDKLSEGTTRFALDLYKSLTGGVGGGKDGNLVFSPVSVSAALSLCLLGARGETAAQLHGALHLGDTPDTDLHEGFAGFLSALGRDDLPYTLRSANRMYARAGYTFLEEFIRDTKKYYFSEASEADFAGNPEVARAAINKWVEEQTGNQIKDLLPSGAISELTALVLVTAVYFKGDWDDKFDPRGTHSRAFLAGGTDMVDTDFMFKARQYKYTRSKELGCRILEIPYKGRDISFTILLPDDPEGLTGLEERLTYESLAAARERMSSTQTELYLPKFRAGYRAELGERLGGLGVTDLFSPGKTDLSGMDGGRQLTVSAAVHSAGIEITEEGAEAAAATGLAVELVSLGELNEFICQHPFMYLIHDNGSGVILFMGRYFHP